MVLIENVSVSNYFVTLNKNNKLSDYRISDKIKYKQDIDNILMIIENFIDVRYYK